VIDLFTYAITRHFINSLAVHDLVPIQTDLLNLNPNPLNLDQKLFFKIFLNFQIK